MLVNAPFWSGISGTVPDWNTIYCQQITGLVSRVNQKLTEMDTKFASALNTSKIFSLYKL
jgi:hypothetical protein